MIGGSLEWKFFPKLRSFELFQIAELRNVANPYCLSVSLFFPLFLSLREEGGRTLDSDRPHVRC